MIALPRASLQPDCGEQRQNIPAAQLPQQRRQTAPQEAQISQVSVRKRPEISPGFWRNIQSLEISGLLRGPSLARGRNLPGFGPGSRRPPGIPRLAVRRGCRRGAIPGRRPGGQRLSAGCRSSLPLSKQGAWIREERPGFPALAWSRGRASGGSAPILSPTACVTVSLSALKLFSSSVSFITRESLSGLFPDSFVSPVRRCPPPRFQAAGHAAPAGARWVPLLPAGRLAYWDVRNARPKALGAETGSTRPYDGLDPTVRVRAGARVRPEPPTGDPAAPRPTGARRSQRWGRRPRPCTLERSRHTRSPGSGGARPPTGRGTPPPHSSAMHSASNRPAAPAPSQPFSPPDFGVGALGVGAPDARTRLVVVWIDAAGGGPSGRRPPPQPRAGPGDGQR